ncbi:glycosyltransferase [Yeosuana sp. MJ-SS3]|uniref:Glycosyltransferase n=1 Tax=Gilvirhabdus luticola TaxID=3079858 RepID=A0ABU3U529_9FLAO|nr:glycosyltransferase [Yeosuana sp. MJ-SS3]MDU8885515.1 glycosyltransferase [Yeosuana sp. MJ-SS3]
MLKTIKKYPNLTICLIVAIMLLPNINVLGVSIMEARNYITAREMVTDGNWLLTTMNGEARYEKPPLPTWLAALSGMVFGLKSLFGLRLPAVVMIMVIGCFTFKLSKKLLSNISHSIINALVVISSFYVIGIIIEAPWDIFTHGFMLIAIYYLYDFFESNNTTYKSALLSGVFIGLSFMCKGPISIYALLVPFVLAYGFSYKYKNFKKKIPLMILILIISLVIGGWWFVYVRLQDPETLIAITKRETGNWSSYNVRPFHYYWSFFTQSGLWAIPAFIGLLYPYLKTRVSNLKAYKLSILWTFFAVILLSVIPEKKSRYLMPVLIPLAFNTGFYIEYLVSNFKNLKDKRETLPVYFNFGLIAIIGITFPIIAYVILKDNLSGFWFWYIASSLLLMSIGILILSQLKKKNIRKVFLLTVAFFTCLLTFGLPLSNATKSDNYNPITNLNLKAKQLNIKIYTLDYVSPEIIWQYGDKIPSIKLEDNTYNFPKEEKIGLLANDINPEDEKLLKSLYKIEKITTYDLNSIPQTNRKHKDRLLNHYYILTRIQ